jgi:hypothetical protein
MNVGRKQLGLSLEDLQRIAGVNGTVPRASPKPR